MARSQTDLPAAVRDELAELERQYGAELRALAPAMSEQFASSLQRRATAGFPRGQQRQRPRRRWTPSHPRLALGGVGAAAVALATALVLIAGAGGRSQLVRGGSGGRPLPASGAATAAGAASTLAAPAGHAPSARGGGAAAAPSGRAGAASPQPAQTVLPVPPVPAPPMPPVPAPVPSPGIGGTREQQLAASLTLSTPAASLERVAGAVMHVADAYGGYVASSQVQSGDGSQSQAQIELELPSGTLGGSLAAISQLAHVTARSQSSTDITNPFQAARRQLQDAVAQRQALLRALAKATTQGQIDSIRQQLGLLGSEIQQYNAAYQQLVRQARLANVSVSIVADAGAGGAGFTIDDALHDAGSVLSVAAGVLLIALAVGVPLAALLALGLFGARALRQRSRERALGAL